MNHAFANRTNKQPVAAVRAAAEIDVLGQTDDREERHELD